MGEGEAKACGVVVGEYGNVADVVFVAAFACGHFDFVQFVDVVGGDGFAIDHAGLFESGEVGTVSEGDVGAGFGDACGFVEHVVGDFSRVVAVGLVAFEVVTKGGDVVIF